MVGWQTAVAWLRWSSSFSTAASCRLVSSTSTSCSSHSRRALCSASTPGVSPRKQQLQPDQGWRLLCLQHCQSHTCSPAAPRLHGASSSSYAATHLWQPLQHRHSSSSSAGSSTSPTTTAQLPGCITACAEVAGQQFTFETGSLAHLAPGAVLIRAGNNTVLATVCVNNDATAAAAAAGDGPQLQVEYRERLVAVGQLPSRADRRDPGGSEREVLGARVVDRALRPLLPPGWAAPTQVVVTLLSCDGGVDPLVLAINAASAAALVAGLPLAGPAAAVQVAALEPGGALRINPPTAGLPPVGGGTRLSLLYAGTHGPRVTALEAAGNQVADPEMVDALEAAAAAAQPLLAAQQQLAAAAVGRPRPTWPGAITWPPVALQREVQARAGSGCAALLQGQAGAGKAAQGGALAALSAVLQQELVEAGLLPDQHSLPGAPGMFTPQQAAAALDLTLSRTMRDTLLAAPAAAQPHQPAAAAAIKGQKAARSKGSKAHPNADTAAAGSAGARLDGRVLAEVRPLTALAGPLPRQVHGSALFSRGDTQSLASVTVGSPREGLGVDTVLGRSEPRFHLHYTFPPYSTGEVGPPRASAAPNRREVGHGALAAKALAPLLRLTSPGNAVTDSALVAGEDMGSSSSGSLGGSTPQGALNPGSRSSSSRQSSRAASSSPLSASQGAGGVDGGGAEGEEFPFAVRVVVDTLASSGSSSMAAVCSGALALKTAGVPLTALAAGISVGCIVANPPHLPQEPPNLQQWAALTATPAAASNNSKQGPTSASACGPFPTPYGPALLLVDIAGSEDHLGDMDFKVGGTAAGITALQLDTKLPGLPLPLVAAALGPAAVARRQVLGVMEGAWAAWEGATPGPLRARHGTTTINRELVPRLVGLQGCNLTAIEEVTGGRLVVGDTGEVALYAPTAAAYDHALEAVAEVEGRSFRKGETVRVRVLQLKDYGALVQLPNGMPALLHISELSHARVREVGDVVVEGQEVQVLVKGRDSRGQLLLSRKALLPLIPQPGSDESQAAPV